MEGLGLSGAAGPVLSAAAAAPLPDVKSCQRTVTATASTSLYCRPLFHTGRPADVCHCGALAWDILGTAQKIPGLADAQKQKNCKLVVNSSRQAVVYLLQGASAATAG